MLFSGKRLDGEARRRRTFLVHFRPRSNEARRPFPRKPSGRRVFWLWTALAWPSQPAAGMLRPRRLVHSQNPLPQHPAQFSDRLLGRGRNNSPVVARERRNSAGPEAGAPVQEAPATASAAKRQSSRGRISKQFLCAVAERGSA